MSDVEDDRWIKFRCRANIRWTCCPTYGPVCWPCSEEMDAQEVHRHKIAFNKTMLDPSERDAKRFCTTFGCWGSVVKWDLGRCASCESLVRATPRMAAVKREREHSDAVEKDELAAKAPRADDGEDAQPLTPCSGAVKSEREPSPAASVHEPEPVANKPHEDEGEDAQSRLIIDGRHRRGGDIARSKRQERRAGLQTKQKLEFVARTAAQRAGGVFLDGATYQDALDLLVRAAAAVERVAAPAAASSTASDAPSASAHPEQAIFAQCRDAFLI